MTCGLSGVFEKFNSTSDAEPVIVLVTTNGDGNCRNFSFPYSTKINKRPGIRGSRDLWTSDDITRDLIIFA